jgi:hypothetical protein
MSRAARKIERSFMHPHKRIWRASDANIVTHSENDQATEVTEITEKPGQNERTTE